MTESVCTKRKENWKHLLRFFCFFLFLNVRIRSRGRNRRRPRRRALHLRVTWRHRSLAVSVRSMFMV